MKHTSAPWEIARSLCGSQFITNGNGKLTVCNSVGGQSGEEQEGNARLIAAAPDLFEACQAWARAKADGGVSMADLYEAAWKKTEKALSKVGKVPRHPRLCGLTLA